MFRAIAMIEPRYLVSVGSTWLRFIAACISPITRPINQRPTIQNASAASTFSPMSIFVCTRSPHQQKRRSVTGVFVSSRLPQAKFASAKSQLTSEVRKVSIHFGRRLR